MSVRSLNRRLADLRRAGATDEAGRIVIIAPDDWPAEARAAYDAACVAKDRELQADLIEAQTGERPVYPVSGLGPIRGVLPPAVIEVRYRADSGA